PVEKMRAFAVAAATPSRTAFVRSWPRVHATAMPATSASPQLMVLTAVTGGGTTAYASPRSTTTAPRGPRDATTRTWKRSWTCRATAAAHRRTVSAYAGGGFGQVACARR